VPHRRATPMFAYLREEAAQAPGAGIVGLAKAGLPNTHRRLVMHIGEWIRQIATGLISRPVTLTDSTVTERQS
jgi:hypothetical protein